MQLKRSELVHIKKLSNLKRLNLYSVRVSDVLLNTIGYVLGLATPTCVATPTFCMHATLWFWGPELARTSVDFAKCIILKLWISIQDVTQWQVIVNAMCTFLEEPTLFLVVISKVTLSHHNTGKFPGKSWDVSWGAQLNVYLIWCRECKQLEHLNLGASVIAVTNDTIHLGESLTRCLSGLKYVCRVS